MYSEAFTAVSGQASLPGRGDLGQMKGVTAMCCNSLGLCRWVAVGAAHIPSLLCSPLSSRLLHFPDMQPSEDISTLPIVSSCEELTGRRKEQRTLEEISTSCSTYRTQDCCKVRVPGVLALYIRNALQACPARAHWWCPIGTH